MDIRSYLRKNEFRLTPLEFFALVNSNEDKIEKILLENADAIYTIILKDGKRIELEYNHQKKELKILEHKITRVKMEK